MRGTSRGMLTTARSAEYAVRVEPMMITGEVSPLVFAVAGILVGLVVAVVAIAVRRRRG